MYRDSVSHNPRRHKASADLTTQRQAQGSPSDGMSHVGCNMPHATPRWSLPFSLFHALGEKDWYVK